MNAKEKTIIEAIIDKSDEQRHRRAMEILVVKDYCETIKKAVRSAFSGWRYKNIEFGDIYNAFLLSFIPLIESMKAETLRSIQNLEGWLFRVAVNCANRHRNEVNEAMGVDVTEEPFLSFDDEVMHEEQEVYNPEEETDLERFDELINEYVDQLPIERDRIIVRAIKIDDMDKTELAAELGLTVPALHLAFEEAWRRVLKRALPDIRYRARKMFKMNEDCLSKNDAAILGDFFNEDAKNLSNKEETKIVDAYKRLIKINKKEL